MPELPEVQTVINILQKSITDETISGVRVIYPGILHDTTTETLEQELPHQVIKGFRRKGKYLIFLLSKGSLIVHLRMEGKFYILPQDAGIEKHVHIVVYFESGKAIHYHDVRKFGTFTYLPTNDWKAISAYPMLGKLGKDANAEWEEDELYYLIHDKKTPVKAVLLDQTVIAGLGNIYVNEVCYLAKVHPLRLASSISKEEANKISFFAKKVLDEAIEYGGTTIRSYTSSLGVTGRFQQFLHVHGKEGEKCSECGTEIIKLKVGGRGTYICPKCQVLRPKVVAITGGIATGKSTLVRLLREAGFQVWVADEEVDLLYRKKAVIDEVAKRFPEVCIEGIIDRKSLGKLIFSDEKARKDLEAIIHPFVYEALDEWIKEHQDEKFVFADIPLLYETNREKCFDEVIVITVPLEINVQRLMARDGIDEQYAMQKIHSQMPLEEKAVKGNYVIDNAGSIVDTAHQLNKILQKIRR